MWFGQAVGGWNDELLEIFRKAEIEKSAPKAPIPSTTLRRGWHGLLFPPEAHKVARIAAKIASRSGAADGASLAEVAKEVERRRDRFVNVVLNFNAFFGPESPQRNGLVLHIGKRFFDSQVQDPRQIRKDGNKLVLPLDYADAMEEAYTDFLKEVFRIEETHRADLLELAESGPQFRGLVTPDGKLADTLVTKAALNAIWLRLWGAQQGAEGLSPEQRRAAVLLALFHPLTDFVIDSEGGAQAIRETAKKGAELIAGKQVAASTAYERILFGLARELFSAYPLDQHPLLREALLRAHDAQMRSAEAQKPSEVSTDPQQVKAHREALMKILAEKAGYTMMVAGYVSFGGLTREQARFFYQAGLPFQIKDDVFDFREAGQIETLVTEELRRTGKTDTGQGGRISGTVKDLLFFQKHLMDLTTQSPSAFSRGFLQNFHESMRLYLMAALFDKNNPIRKETGMLKKWIPVPKSALGTFYRSLSTVAYRVGSLRMIHEGVFEHDAQKSFLSGKNLNHYDWRKGAESVLTRRSRLKGGKL